MDEALAKLRSEIIEGLYQMGYSIDGEAKGVNTSRLEFFRSDSPKVTVIIEKGE